MKENDGRISKFGNINPRYDFIIPIFFKVNIDLAFFFEPQTVSDKPVWFHSGINLNLLSAFAQDIKIWVFFDPILATITSGTRIKISECVKPVIKIYLSLLSIVILTLLSLFVHNVKIMGFLHQILV